MDGLGAATLYSSENDIDWDYEPTTADKLGKKFEPIETVFVVDPFAKDQLGVLLACARRRLGLSSARVEETLSEVCRFV